MSTGNYNEVDVEGKSYLRAFEVNIANPLVGEKSIRFSEEEVITLNGRELQPIFKGNLIQPFNYANTHTQFAVVDPITGVPTGEMKTYGEMYAMLHSLYFHLVKERDNA